MLPTHAYALALGMIFASACSFNLPQAPTLSVRRDEELLPETLPPPYVASKEYLRLSPLAAILDSKSPEPSRRMAVDAAYRCESRVNVLVGKMNNARKAAAGITISAGTVTAASAVVTAILTGAALANSGSDDELNVAAIGTAGFTAANSLLTLIGAQIAQPVEVLEIYKISMKHYNKAAQLTLAIAGVDAAKPEQVQLVVDELNACSDSSTETLAPVVLPLVAQQPWTEMRGDLAWLSSSGDFSPTCSNVGSTDVATVTADRGRFAELRAPLRSGFHRMLGER